MKDSVRTLGAMYGPVSDTTSSTRPGTVCAVVGHVLRNSLIPVVTAVGLEFGRLLGGAIVVESVFAWPGLGTLMLQSISNRDYGIVQAGLLLLVLVFITVNLLTDIAYGFLDPRIRLSGGRRA